jgi:hypothetical protein
MLQFSIEPYMLIFILIKYSFIAGLFIFFPDLTSHFKNCWISSGALVQRTHCEAIHQFNIDICSFIMTKALWSLDSTVDSIKALQERLDDYCVQYNNLNYQKKLDDKQVFVELDRARILLSYANQVLQQRAAASRFMKRVSLLQGQKPLGEAEFLFLQKEFKSIKYPMVEIEGLYRLFYVYQQDIYLTLSQIYTSCW